MEHNQEKSGGQGEPLAGTLGGASRLGAPCVEYGLIDGPIDWEAPVCTPGTFAALVAEHRAWRAMVLAKEQGDKSPVWMVEALKAGYESAKVMQAAQADLPLAPSSEPAERSGAVPSPSPDPLVKELVGALEAYAEWQRLRSWAMGADDAESWRRAHAAESNFHAKASAALQLAQGGSAA